MVYNIIIVTRYRLYTHIFTWNNTRMFRVLFFTHKCIQDLIVLLIPSSIFHMVFLLINRIYNNNITGQLLFIHKRRSDFSFYNISVFNFGYCLRPRRVLIISKSLDVITCGYIVDVIIQSQVYATYTLIRLRTCITQYIMYLNTKSGLLIIFMYRYMCIYYVRYKR